MSLLQSVSIDLVVILIWIYIQLNHTLGNLKGCKVDFTSIGICM
jgi:hypothetical protein